MKPGLATDYLKSEHDLIERMLKIIRVMILRAESDQHFNLDHLKEVLNFLSGYADHIHHAKEENILFEPLKKQGVLPGGPRCSYYFDLSLQRSSVTETISKLNQEMGLGGSVSLAGTIPGSPLNKVIEEHILGRKYVEHLRYEIDHEQNFFKILTSLNAYQELLTEHIEKENGCLFPMLDGLISDEAQRNIVLKFEELDSSPEGVLALTKYSTLVDQLSRCYIND